MPLPLALAFDLQYDKFFVLGLLEFIVVYQFYVAFSLFFRRQDKEIFGPQWRLRFRSEFLSVQRMLDFVHIFVALKLVLTVHAIIKQSIPLINPKLYDQDLLALELLLRGFNPMTLAAQYCGDYGQFLDWSYVAWFKIASGVATFYNSPESVLMQRFFLGFLAYGASVG
jgi:hypothetical protein